MKPQKKCFRIEVRLTLADYSRIKTLASIYTNGNASKWLRHAALNAPREMMPKTKKPRGFTKAPGASANKGGK